MKFIQMLVNYPTSSELEQKLNFRVGMPRQPCLSLPQAGGSVAAALGTARLRVLLRLAG